MKCMWVDEGDCVGGLQVRGNQNQLDIMWEGRRGEERMHPRSSPGSTSH